ncbi:hypothetical protein MRB53_041898 [Persea americana]|nr:hypothetical protein MRB53_041898 [Persea americana]
MGRTRTTSSAPTRSLVFATAVEYGAFGVKNLFELYPILPWCFLIGAVTGIGWALVQRFGPRVKAYAQSRWSQASFNTFNKYICFPLELLAWSIRQSSGPAH